MSEPIRLDDGSFILPDGSVLTPDGGLARGAFQANEAGVPLSPLGFPTLPLSQRSEGQKAAIEAVAGGVVGTALLPTPPPVRAGAVGLTQYGLSRLGGDPEEVARREGIGAGGLELAVPSLLRGAAKAGPAIGRGVARLTSKGTNAAGQELVETTGRMLAGVPPPQQAGHVASQGAEEVIRKSKEPFEKAYAQFRKLGGNAPVDFEDVVTASKAKLRQGAVRGTEGRPVYEKFISLADDIKAGNADVMDVKGLDDYLSSLKRAQRSATDKNAKQAYKDLIPALETKLDKAMMKATGSPKAMQELSKGRAAFKAHQRKFARRSNLTRLEGATDDEAAKILKNLGRQDIADLKAAMPEEDFTELAQTWMRDKLIGVDPDLIGGTEGVTFKSLKKRLQNRELRGKFDAFWGDKAADWVGKVDAARTGEKAAEALWILGNGSILLPVAAAAGLSGGGAAGIIAAPLAASVMMKSASGRRLIEISAKAARNPVAARSVLQRLRAWGQENGLPPESFEMGETQ